MPPKAARARGHQTRSADQPRVLGPRALATRRRLLDATADLLGTTGLLDLKVVEIARSIKTSPGTFYQYFPTVEHAILELSDEIDTQLEPLRDLLAHDWTAADGLSFARAFVSEYVDHFDRNRAILRIRNLSAQEGDIRFRKSRNNSLLPMTQALAAKVEANQAAGAVSAALNPFAAGGALMALIERMAAFRAEFEWRGVGRDALIETTAMIVWQTVSGGSAQAQSDAPAGAFAIASDRL